MKSDKHFFFSWSGDRISAAVDLLLVRFENLGNCMKMTLRKLPLIAGEDLNFVESLGVLGVYGVNRLLGQDF